MPVYVDRYSQLLSKLLGAAGQEAVHSLSPELMASIILENDRPEWAVLGGTRLFMGRQFLAASAANASSIAISGIQSDTLVVITHAICRTTVLLCGIPLTLTGYAPAASFIPRDNRLTGGFNAKYFTRQTAVFDAPAGAIAMDVGILYPINVVLGLGRIGPQRNLLFESTVVNVQADVTVFGYERTADKHEEDASVVG